MIISCACGARLKIGDEKLTDSGVRIKCPKCGTVHLAKKDAVGHLSSASPVSGPQPSAASTPATMPWFASSSPSAPPGGALVLVAHDSGVVAEMIAGTLQEAGMSTDYAPNGLEALKKATELKPQAMVVDVGLTGIYGFELCERLKSDAGTKEIKIVLLSSVYGLTAYKRSPVSLYGADDYIEKHHIPDQLVPKLRKLLSGEPTPSRPPTPPSEPDERVAVASAPGQTAPLVSRKGVLQQAPPSLSQAAEPTVPPEPSSAGEVRPPASTGTRSPAPSASTPAAPAPKRGIELPDIPSILPKTPVTLGGEPDRVSWPTAAAPPRQREEEPRSAPDAPPSISVVPPEPMRTETTLDDTFADGSVKLDAGFFEPEEYDAPLQPQAPANAVDPLEIEKAQRFARLIVSDIVLYNEDAVAEGIQKGTLFDLLKDDIAEGRNLYENRVPLVVRSGKDYLQDAFDDFIASKKKLR